jgi:hypothetical protein
VIVDRVRTLIGYILGRLPGHPIIHFQERISNLIDRMMALLPARDCGGGIERWVGDRGRSFISKNESRI